MINNLRDIAGDGSAGIRTIPMRLGERYSKIALSALVLAAPLLTLALGASGHWPRMALLAACIAFAPASCVVRRIMKARGLQSELADGPQSVAKLYATYGALVAAVFLAA
jgi:1,4-dihydroxy-2-naphthoate octaprenyltransferase